MKCKSGKHVWLDEEDRKRCCNGYERVQGTSRHELEKIGAEHIVLRQLFRGWCHIRPIFRGLPIP